MKTLKNKIKVSLIVLSLLIQTVAVGLPSTADAALGTVGPVNPNNGFPAWYTDTNGLGLDLMEAADSFGISDPVDPANAFSQQIGFNAEGFYWSSEASIDNGTQTGLLVLALEAAFAGEAAVDGEQSVFGRIRYRINGLTPLETYTVTHPFGSVTEVADADGVINVTNDIGGFAQPGFPANFAIPLSSGVGPFLTWDTFGQTPTDPLLINPANPLRRYVGNPTVDHAVVGGTNGNSFTVTGPGLTNFTTNLFSVTGRIADVEPPVITLNGVDVAPNTTNITAGTAYVEAGATATDNFDGVIDPATIQAVSNVPAGILTLPRPVGESLTVTYTVSDKGGNVATAVRTVNVVPDIIPPVVTILGANPVNILVGNTYTDAGATSTDNVDGVIDVITTGLPIDTSVVATFTVTYTATDSSNNVTTATRTVNVAQDVIAPVITITGENPALVSFGATYTDAGATALDDFDGDRTANIIVTGLPIDTRNTTTPQSVTYTVVDLSGNTATAVRTISIVPDTTAPVITLNGANPLAVEQGTTYVEPGATALDDVDGDRTVTITGTVNTAVIGPNTITYTATDLSGNIGTVTRTVNVVTDATPPVITVLGDSVVTILVGTTYVDAGATASDTLDGDRTANIVITGLPINTNAEGAFTVTYTVSDIAGNVTTATRTVNVTTDVTAPVIVLKGVSPVSVTIGSVYTDAGATALDDIDGDITARIVTTNNVNTSILGNYTVTYNVTDLVGNAATQVSRTVRVVNAGGGGRTGGGGGAVTAPGQVLGATTDDSCLSGQGHLFDTNSGRPCTPGQILQRLTDSCLAGLGHTFDTNSGRRCAPGQVLGATSGKFIQHLRHGMSGDSVKDLQERLRAEGHFTFPTSTGFFGDVTLEAVKKFQAARGVPATGFVGPLTLAELNKDARD